MMREIMLQGYYFNSYHSISFNHYEYYVFPATCFIIAAACCGSFYWAEDTNVILGLSSVFIAMSSIGGAAVINVIVDNFPTCLRCDNNNRLLYLFSSYIFL